MIKYREKEAREHKELVLKRGLCCKLYYLDGRVRYVGYKLDIPPVSLMVGKSIFNLLYYVPQRVSNYIACYQETKDQPYEELKTERKLNEYNSY